LTIMPAPPLRVDTTEIIVIGRPAPQGSKRHLGRGVMVEWSKAVKPWREAVKSAAADLGEPALLDVPLEVVVTFTVHKPAGGARSRTGASPSALRDAARARVGTKHRLPLDLPSSAGRGIAAGQAPVVVSAVPDVTPAVNAGAA